jgi:hypothetical protein
MPNPLSALRGVPGVARRAAAVVLIALQLALIVAPLAEVGLFDGEGSLVAADRGDPGRVTGTRAGGPASSHDELTCPACIARSLHSRPGLQAPLLISQAEQHARPPLAAVTARFGRPTAFHFSRAPPIAG